MKAIPRNMSNKFSKLTLDQVEKELEKFRSLSYAARRDFIFGLIYMKTDNRFRQIPVHKNDTFEKYLNSRWLMNLREFTREEFGFRQYTEFSMEFGAGTVWRARVLCGTLGVHKVVNGIIALKKRRKTFITLDDVDKIIYEHAKVKPEPDGAYSESKAELRAELYEAQLTIQNQAKTIRMKDEQIDKLKKSVMELQKSVA